MCYYEQGRGHTWELWEQHKEQRLTKNMIQKLGNTWMENTIKKNLIRNIIEDQVKVTNTLSA
jgi:hypothetical protein